MPGPKINPLATVSEALDGWAAVVGFDSVTVVPEMAVITVPGRMPLPPLTA